MSMYFRPRVVMAEAQCEWCGETHSFKCPLVEAIEYYPGPEKQIRRVKFFRPKPVKVTKTGLVPSYGPAVTYPTSNPIYSIAETTAAPGRTKGTD